MVAAAELAKPWPLALIVDHLLADREAPFTLDVGLAARDRRPDPRHRRSPSPPRTYFTDLWLQSAGERITHELRVAIYDHLQRLSLAFHQRTQKGDLLTRVTEDVNDMGELFSDTLGEMLQSALLALGMTVVLLFIDPVLALLSLTTAPLLVVISFVFRRKVRERARRSASHEGDLASRRQRGALRDGRREGLRRRGAWSPSACAAAASSGWASASRSRACRPASTAPSASCAPSPPRS